MLAIAAILMFVALPTLKPSEAEATAQFAKETLQYLHAREQRYYNTFGKYADFATIAADETLGADFDQRFAAEDGRPVVEGITFAYIAPPGEAQTFEIVASLPDDTGKYKVDQTGQITTLE